MRGISSRFLRILPTVALAAAAIAALVFTHHRGFTPGGGGAGAPEPLQIASSSIPQGRIPAPFTCDGANTSPALAWTAPPANTKSFALVVADRDAASGSFVHWVLFDLPPETRSLPEAVQPLAQLPDGSRQGRNDFEQIGYRGPCPPDHGTHRYLFSLLALDITLNLPPGVPPDQIEEATQGHVVARGVMTATYSH
jgi:Raf kinase inhibitor-like YbhB/YbcL family protein